MEYDLISVGGDIGDHLSFCEIARAWSKVSGDNPEMLMAALVTSFWRGEFESNAQSALFMLLKPDSQPFSASSERGPGRRPFLLGAGIPSRPGDYTIRGKAVYKTGDDLEPNVTAERKRFHIFREDIARLFYTPRGQRGLMSGEPRDFEGWSFDRRNSACPNWRAKYEDFYHGLATIPFEQWPTVPYDMRDSCSLWCIRRDVFARWYCASPLSAGAPLDSFWPLPDRLKSAVGPLSRIASSDVIVATVPGREPYGPAIHAADRYLFPNGPPEGMSVSKRRNEIRKRLKEEHGIDDVSDKTFQRCGIKRNTRKSPAHRA